MKESELRSRVEVLGKKSSAVERSKVATAAEHRAELAEVNKKLQEWMLKAQRGTQTHLASHSDVIGDSEAFSKPQIMEVLRKLAGNLDEAVATAKKLQDENTTLHLKSVGIQNH